MNVDMIAIWAFVLISAFANYFCVYTLNRVVRLNIERIRNLEDDFEKHREFSCEKIAGLHDNLNNAKDMLTGATHRLSEWCAKLQKESNEELDSRKLVDEEIEKLQHNDNNILQRIGTLESQPEWDFVAAFRQSIARLENQYKELDSNYHDLHGRLADDGRHIDVSMKRIQRLEFTVNRYRRAIAAALNEYQGENETTDRSDLDDE